MPADFRLLNDALVRQHVHAFSTSRSGLRAVGQKDQEET
jgi:hypothetical protein